MGRRWQFGVGGGGQGVQERRPAGREGQATPRGRAGQVSAESLPRGAQPVWVELNEGGTERRRGQGQGAPRYGDSELCKTLGFYSTSDEMAKLKKPAFTTPAGQAESWGQREKQPPPPRAPRAVKCPPTNSDLRCRTAPPTSTRMDWNTFLDLYAVFLMKIYYTYRWLRQVPYLFFLFLSLSVLALLSSRNIFKAYYASCRTLSL